MDAKARTTFNLGQLVATPAALDALSANGQRAEQFLVRHVYGDWGDLDPPDKQANDHARKSGGRLLSAYTLGDGQKLWIIPEADRRSTCLLLPEDY